MMVMNWLEILQSPVRVQAFGPMNVSHTVKVSDFTRMFISDIHLHFSHPLDKNITFYRYLRFFYPGLLSQPRF